MAAQTPTETSNPTKRIRWATHRAPGKKGQKKRESILAKLSAHRRTPSKGSRDSTGSTFKGKIPEDPDSQDSPTKGADTQAEDSEQWGPARRVYFNIPLPAEERDEEGKPLIQYARNKIRTAKYTALR
jgi:phospholipid-translocating ATPase